MVTVPKHPRGGRRPRPTSTDTQPDPQDYMMALAVMQQHGRFAQAADQTPAQVAQLKRAAPPPMQEAPESATPEQNIGVMGGSR